MLEYELGRHPRHGWCECSRESLDRIMSGSKGIGIQNPMAEATYGITVTGLVCRLQEHVGCLRATTVSGFSKATGKTETVVRIMTIDGTVHATETIDARLSFD